MSFDVGRSTPTAELERARTCFGDYPESMWRHATVLAALALASLTLGTEIASSGTGVGVYRGEGRSDRTDRFERWLGTDVTHAVDFIKNVGWTPRGAIVGPWRRSDYTLSLSVRSSDTHPATGKRSPGV